jgi:hypothetical protein
MLSKSLLQRQHDLFTEIGAWRQSTSDFPSYEEFRTILAEQIPPITNVKQYVSQYKTIQLPHCRRMPREPHEIYGISWAEVFGKTKNKTLEDAVQDAEKLVNNNGGEVPHAKWLSQNGYNHVYKYRNHPSLQHLKFARLRPSKLSKEDIIKRVEKIAEDNNGILPTTTVMQKQYSSIDKYIRKHPDWFTRIPRETGFKPLSLEAAMNIGIPFAKEHGINSGLKWTTAGRKGLLPEGLPTAPTVVYKDHWKEIGGWGGFLGIGQKRKNDLSWNEFRQIMIQHPKINSISAYKKWYASIVLKNGKKLPIYPHKVFKKTWNECLGKQRRSKREDIKNEFLQMAQDKEPRPKGRLATCRLWDLMKTDSIFADKMKKLAPSWFVTQSDKSSDKKKTLLQMAKNGQNKPGWKTNLGMSLSSYIRTSHGCYDKDFASQIKSIRPDWFVRLSNHA